MSVATGSSAETRSLPLRRRADLECREFDIGGTRFWHVKDPVSLRYFQLKPEEHAVLMLLDGTASLRDIKRRFEEDFAPQRLALSQLQSFLVMLHSSGLIVSDSAAQADVLLGRHRSNQRRRLLAAASSILSIRFRGFDPHRLLNHLTPLVGWMFRPTGACLCCLSIVAGLLFAMLKIDALQAKLPRFHEFFAGPNLLWLAVTLAATKVLHEFGHALSCRHFKAECHEMGLMLLIGTPCLYCNVSDAWMLKNRWHRIVVSAAGMYFELLLASVCLGLWWLSVPSFFNSLCLNVVFVCSVTTVLFNGNPLLRYDGYYILADFAEIPNLRQQASALVGNSVGRWFFDTDVANRRLIPEQRQTFLAGWFIAAAVYRLLMVWGILWFVQRVLEPYGLEPVALALGLVTISGVVLSPLLQLGSLLSNPFWNRTVNWQRFWLRSLLVVIVLSSAAIAPLPYSVKAPVVVQPENAQRIFVPQSGRLVWTIAAGQQVAIGDELAKLSNSNLERDVARLTGEVAQHERQLQNLESRRLQDREAVDALIPTAQERLTKKRDELKQRQTDVEKLTLRAPIAGRVLSAPVSKPLTTDDKADEKVGHWSGSPLDPQNIGATLETGTELCLIAPTERFEATLAIDQNEVEFISPGQRVELLLDHIGLSEQSGVILEVAEIDLSVAPRELVEHAHFPTKVGSDGVARPVSTAYLARVRLDPAASNPTYVLRGTGYASIEAAQQSAFARLSRFVRLTFRFR